MFFKIAIPMSWGARYTAKIDHKNNKMQSIFSVLFAHLKQLQISVLFNT